MNVCSKISSRGLLELGLKGLVGDSLMNFILDSVILLVPPCCPHFFSCVSLSTCTDISPATAWDTAFLCSVSTMALRHLTGTL